MAPEVATGLVGAVGAFLILLALFARVLPARPAEPDPAPTEVATVAAVEAPPVLVPDVPTPLPTPTATSAPPTSTATLVPTATPLAVSTATPAVVASPTRVIQAARSGAGVPILMYHYIRVNPDPRDEIGYGLSISPDLFAAHMAWLAGSGYRVVPMRDLNQYVGTGRLPTEKWVVLTFDDGYRDAYGEAWPVLKRYGFGATIYAITDLIDSPRYLTKEQLRELAAAGIEIGSHSATHPELSALNPAKLRHEVADSRAVLERIVGGPVLSFCYPSGHHTAVVRQAVQAAGYQSAVTVEPGLFRGREERFQIPRVRVYGGMGLSSLARALGEPRPDSKRWPGQLDDRPYVRPPAAVQGRR